MTTTLERSERHRMEDNTFLQIRIDELKAEKARLREALMPFADACDEMFNDWCPDETPAWHDAEENESMVSVGDFRRARQALGSDK